MDNTNNNNSNDGMSSFKWRGVSQEDELIIVGFIIGFAVGVVIMYIVTN